MDERRRIFRAGNGLADGDAFHSRHCNDVPEFGLCDIGPLQPGEREQFRDLGLLDRAVELRDPNFLTGAHGPIEDARNGKPSQIIAVIEIGDQYLQGPRGVAFGRGNSFHNRVEQRLQVFPSAFDIG